MRRRRIISCKSKTPIQVEKSFSFSAFVLKLWLCEPLYLPALRATFFQKKALSGVASRRILFYALNAGGLAHVRCSATSIQTAEILKRDQL